MREIEVVDTTHTALLDGVSKTLAWLCQSQPGHGDVVIRVRNHKVSNRVGVLIDHVISELPMR